MRVKLDTNAIKPTKAHENDAGYDLYSRTQAEVLPRTNHSFDTGVHVEIPHGYVGLVCGRSGLNFNKHLVLGGIGIIDENYRGTIGVKLYNEGEWTQCVNPGDRIAQLVIVPCYSEGIDVVDELSDTDRGSGGFGSSGR